MKTVTIRELLTQEQIELAMRLGNAKAIYEQITLPHIAEINDRVGQENDPMYLAYVITAALEAAWAAAIQNDASDLN